MKMYRNILKKEKYITKRLELGDLNDIKRGNYYFQIVNLKKS
jgi:hypothetical protein